MKTDAIMDAIGEIDFKYVQEAEEYRAERNPGGRSAARSRSGGYKKLLPLAACLALALGAGAYGLRYGAGEGADAGGMSGAAEESVDMAGSAPMEGAAAESGGQKKSAEESGAGAMDAGAADSGAEECREAENMMETGIAGEQVYVNEITEVTRTCYDIAGPVRTEYYSADALEDYYGTKLVPQTIPEDLRMSEDLSETKHAAAEDLSSGEAEAGTAPFAVGYDAEGNVVDDNNRLCWQNEDGTRSLVIAAYTVPAGEVLSFPQEDLKYSLIAGREVMLTHFADGQGADNYLAYYVKNGVTVTAESCGMTQEELLNVLWELLAEEPRLYNRAE